MPNKLTRVIFPEIVHVYQETVSLVSVLRGHVPNAMVIEDPSQDINQMCLNYDRSR